MVVVGGSDIVVVVVRVSGFGARRTCVRRTGGHADSLTAAVVAVARRRCLLIVGVEVVVDMVGIVVTIRRAVVRVVAVRAVGRVVVVAAWR